MSKIKLIETLKDLKENRRLSSESEEILAPFIGQSFTLSFRFLSSSRSFTNRHDPRYSNGQTLIGEFINSNLECSIIFSPDKNLWVDGLDEKEEFDCDVVVLELDNLYQRVLFGQLFNEKPADLTDIEAGSLPEHSSIGNENQLIDESNLDAVTEAETLVENKKTDGTIKSVDENETVSDENLRPPISDLKTHEVDIAEVVKEVQNAEPVGEGNIDSPIPKTPENKEDRKEVQSEEQIQVDPLPVLLNQPVDGEVQPPPLPGLPSAKIQREYDYFEVERIRNKRYEHGADSLTSEEQEILTHDRVQNASSRKKNLVESQNVLNKGARLFFGIVFIFVSLSSFSSDSVFVGLILLGVSGYLLKPFVSDLD